MKKLVGISLFIFFAVVTALLVSGLVFYQNKKINNGSAGLVLDAAEVAKHNFTSDCWVVISGKIYNVTSLISNHSGGAGAIIPYCGKDGTEVFNTKGGKGEHSSSAKNILDSYFIGDLNQQINSQQLNQNIQNTNSAQNGKNSRDENENEDD